MGLKFGCAHEQIDNDSSAEMNMWLHKIVLQKFAANGGKLPEGLFSVHFLQEGLKERPGKILDTLFIYGKNRIWFVSLP